MEEISLPITGTSTVRRISEGKKARTRSGIYHDYLFFTNF